MKCLKTLGLVTAAALMVSVSAGTASATVLQSGGGEVFGKGTKIDASAEASVSWELGAFVVTCTESTIVGVTTNTGSSTETVQVNLEGLIITGCTEATVTVMKRGSLEIHTAGANPDGNGTLTSSGTEVTFARFGASCTYATSTTDLGVITGSANTGTTATVDVNAKLKKVAGSFLCSTEGTWEGVYKVTEPDYLDVI